MIDITKTCQSNNIIQGFISAIKTENVVKNTIFIVFAQNIDCG